MRLFSALRPPAEVAAEVAAALGEGGPGLRWSEPGGWHVTLAFYGEADPAERVAFLREALAGRPPVEVRLGAAGTFPGVLWLAAGGAGLAELAEAAGAGAARPYRPHLTLARFPPDRGPGEWPARLAGFAGSPWSAGRVVLMASGGGRYREVAAFPLHRA
ncbi:2'-5' RNA ligase family protein [Amycolatopsis sp. PS_44_ISF1]|uniref:2'-5' RNA ligase family protein n=1 Tax=Amycolatopsis sp. PS_44_ISF1 TaxID=2974917 RepID=UPI0028E096C8|nr:2'-5' RNA ligase family protein [Amycolatopsis sp. PS_44_ISF1]MDT8914810.1 2'-5' RNA ligase family protein [Amycolatopsis sp. PS_44_ISF1]